MAKASPSIRSVESGTGSHTRIFRTARLELTALYVGILVAIIIGFSVFLYHGTLQNLTDVGYEDFTGIDARAHFVAQAASSIEHDLIFADISILFSAACLSYFLAGFTLDPVRQSLEAQRAFSSQASHELRTPLAIVRNETEVVLRNPRLTLSEARRTLESNGEEAQKLADIVENLLLLARSDQGVVLPNEAVDLSDLTRNAVAKIRPLAEAKGTVMEFSGETAITVNGSASDLERVLLNVLRNSVTHTSDGTIGVACTQSSSTACVTVSDTGTGILPEEMPHIFERFYSGRLSEGTGLGLSIVKAIVQQHGGTLRVASDAGEGTEVTISLPRA